MSAPNAPSARRRRSVRPSLAGLAALAFVAPLVACGDDPDRAAPATTVAAETSEAPETSIAGVEVPALCTAWIETDRAGSALGDPDAPPEVAQEATQAISDALDGVSAPAGLEAQLDAASAAVADALEGDLGAFETPTFTAAIADLAAWVHEDCGFAQVEVDAVDHAFEGLEDPIPAGPVSFRLSNGGADAHVMVLHRFDEDSQLDAAALVEAMEAPGSTALDDETEPVVSGAFAPPGGEGFITADLEPGRYLVFCPIPSGFAGDGPPDPTAAPHVSLGMYAELTVA